MKIIILSPSKKNTGGVERFSFYLKQVLERNKNNKVEILGSEDLNPHLNKFLTVLNKVGLGQVLTSYFLGRQAAKNGFDVCVTNGMLGWNLKNKKLINIQHGTFALSAYRIDWATNKIKFLIKRYFWGYYEGLAARNSLLCVAVSGETKDSVRKYYHSKNATVIPNAIDTEFFKPKNKEVCRLGLGLPLDKKILVFVGRFEYGKGADILEEIKIKSSSLGVILVVAENFSQNELVDLYNAADLFIFPSRHEGCSYALLEAMSCGLIPVMSPVGLVPELREQGLFTECIVENHTPEDYLSKINFLTNLPDSAKKDLSNKLREYIANNHSLQTFDANYNLLFKQISSL